MDGDYKDIVLGSTPGQFAILCSDKILLAGPRRQQKSESQGALAVRIKYASCHCLDDFSQDPIGRFTRDSKKLAVLHPFSSSMHLWELEKGIKMGPILCKDPDHEKFCDFSFSVDGMRMVTGMSSGSLEIWLVCSESGVKHITAIDVLPASAKSQRRGIFFNGVTFSHDEKGEETVVVCDGNGYLRWYQPHRATAGPKSETVTEWGLHMFPRNVYPPQMNTLDLTKWDLICTENAHGTASCEFASDGLTGVLMSGHKKGFVWDLVKRAVIKSFEYKVHLGRGSRIPFPDNISRTGDFSVVGMRENDSEFVVCTPDTTYENLAEQVGQHMQQIDVSAVFSAETLKQLPIV